jgi:uncharacterized phage protein gp47/JayE
MTYSYENGKLTVPTLQEIINRRVTEKQIIYGGDINLDSDTPDGQDLNIQAQMEADISEILTDYFNGLKVDNAMGQELDNLANFKGLKRLGGTYTIIPITVVTNRDVSLETSFKIQDSSNNVFYLQSPAILEAGTHILNFVSEAIGNINPPTNTLNEIVTVTLGVVSVNNENNPLYVGVEEEDDYTFRNRVKTSSIIGGKGGVDNIRSTILQVDGVIDCQIDSNRTNVVNENGTPAHYNWIVVNGGKDEDIANAIYSTINGGVGMKGNVVVPVTTEQNTLELITFDRPQAEYIYITFHVTARESDVIIDLSELKQYLISNFKSKVNYIVDNNQILSLLINYREGIYLYSNCMISKDGTNWQVIAKNTLFNNYFSLSADNIIATQ